MEQRIIGFAGRARCGKSQLCKFLKDERNAKILTIALYLKKLCCDLIDCNTIDELNDRKNNPLKDKEIIPNVDLWSEKIAKVTNINKEDVANELKKYPVIENTRLLLQIIGSDIIRKYYPDWHIDCLINEIKLLKDNSLIVIDDVRFPNEKKKIEEIGGEIFFIIRPEIFHNVSNHWSETSLNYRDFKFNRIIVNKPEISKDDLKNGIINYYDNNVLDSNIFFNDETSFTERLHNNVRFPYKIIKAISDIVNSDICKTLTKERKYLTFRINCNENTSISDYFRLRNVGTNINRIEANDDTILYEFNIKNPFEIEDLKLLVL